MFEAEVGNGQIDYYYWVVLRQDNCRRVSSGEVERLNPKSHYHLAVQNVSDQKQNQRLIPLICSRVSD